MRMWLPRSPWQIVVVTVVAAAALALSAWYGPLWANGAPLVAVPNVQVRDAWVRQSLAGLNSALYVTIENHGDQPVVIVGGTSEVAGRVEIHDTFMETAQGVDGRPTQTMRMQEAAAHEIPAHGALTWSPGGKHIMLLGLTQDLAIGEMIEVTLYTQDGAAIPVHAVVGEPTAAQQGMHGGEHHH